MFIPGPSDFSLRRHAGYGARADKSRRWIAILSLAHCAVLTAISESSPRLAPRNERV
jgi:hypothetical protein